jgi:hypothetical protein
MPYHQSSAASVATVLTAATVIVIGYRIGRAHAAWRDVRSAKRDVPAKRRVAWGQTRPLIVGAVFLMLTIVATAYDASH